MTGSRLVLPARLDAHREGRAARPRERAHPPGHTAADGRPDMSERTDPDAEAGQGHLRATATSTASSATRPRPSTEVPDLGDEPVVDEPLVQEELTGGAVPITTSVCATGARSCRSSSRSSSCCSSRSRCRGSSSTSSSPTSSPPTRSGSSRRSSSTTSASRCAATVGRCSCAASEPQVRVRDSTEIIFVSWLVNSVVPAKLGDVYRAWLLKINFPVSLSATFGTIFIERIFDLVRHRHPRARGGVLVVPRRPVGRGPRDHGPGRRGRRPPVGRRCSRCATSAVASSSGCRCRHRVVGLYDRFEEGVFSVDRRTPPDRRVPHGPHLDDRGDAPPVRRASARLRHPHRHQWRLLRRPRRVPADGRAVHAGGPRASSRPASSAS